MVLFVCLFIISLLSNISVFNDTYLCINRVPLNIVPKIPYLTCGFYDQVYQN